MTDMAAATDPSVAGPPATTSRRPKYRHMAKFLRTEFPLALSVGYLLLLVFCALFPEILAHRDPDVQNLMAKERPPSAEHWLGTDALGRDQFSRLVHGTRVALMVALQAPLIALAIGLPAGLVAGYSRGVLDAIFSRIAEALQSLPGLILAIAVVGVLGTGIRPTMLAIGIVFAPRVFRLVRIRAIEVSAETFIEALRAVGASTARILCLHVLPNIAPTIVVVTIVLVGHALLIEAALSFLGLGVQPPTSSWGQMLGTAYASIYDAPHLILFPGLVIVCTIVAISFIGDALSARWSAGRR